MMEKKQTTLNTGIGIGGVSILAIFVVLCLVTLASLSLVSARADYTLAQKTAESMQEYYGADAQAEVKLGELMALVQEGKTPEEIANSGFSVKTGGNVAIVSYSVVMNQIKNLYVEIELGLDERGIPTGDYVKTAWQTQVVDDGSSGDENTLNVFS